MRACSPALRALLALLPPSAPALAPSLAPLLHASFSARHSQLSTGEPVAVKSCVIRMKGSKPAADPKYVAQEIDCLKRLQDTMHCGVANLLATHEGKYEIHLILQYCNGGSLHRHLQGLDFRSGMAEPAAASVLSQVADALAHIHQRGVTHRDIKAANVVFDSPDKVSVRLVDFGFAALHFSKPPPMHPILTGASATLAPAAASAASEAPGPAPAGAPAPAPAADGPYSLPPAGAPDAAAIRTQYGRRLHTLCGTPSCMAPELVKGGAEGHSRAGYLGPPVDVWALACLAFEMLTCRPAFTAESMAALHVRILRCSHAPFPDFVSTRAKAFIRSLLVVEPLERPTAADAAMRLSGLAFPPTGLRKAGSNRSTASGGGGSLTGSELGALVAPAPAPAPAPVPLSE